MEINREILRWVILIGAAPIWWPFLRMIWADFNDALREDGGLFGKPPSPRELERLRRERANQPDPFWSEPLVRPGDRRAPRLRSGRTDAPRASDGQGRGFRG
jgi:hypothetical protein